MAGIRTISNSFCVTTVDDPIYVTLTNDMDGVACDKNGVTTSEQSVSTIVSVYEGSTKLTLSGITISIGGTTISSDYAQSGTGYYYKATKNLTTGAITVTVRQGTTISSKTQVDISVSSSALSTPRSNTLVINGVRAGADGSPAMIYNLVPLVTEIIKKKDGTYEPTGNTYITCDVTKNVGGTISTPAASEYTLKYSLNGGEETEYTSESVKANQVTSTLVFILYDKAPTPNVIDRETIGLITDGADGTSAFVADIDNMMSGVGVDEDGKTEENFNATLVVNAFYGSTSVISSCTVTPSTTTTGIQTSYTSGTHSVSVSVPSGTTIGSKAVVSISVVHATYGTRTLTFTLAGLEGGADAVIQELFPSRDFISFARQSDGSLTPPSRTLTLDIKKTSGGTTEIQSLSAAGLTIRWSVTSMPTTSSGGYNWGNGTPTGITWNVTTMTIASSISYTNIYIAAFNSGGTLVDQEIIPIVKDGENGADGENAAIVFATPDKISVQCWEDGGVISQTVKDVSFSMKVGTHTATITSNTRGTLPSGTQVFIDAVTYSVASITIKTTATAAGLANGITFTLTGTYDGNTYTASTTVAIIGSLQGGQGDPGQRGKTGRFYYYGGEFDSANNAKTFGVSDAQVPYFSHGVTGNGLPNCHVFDYDTNGNYTMSQMWSISSSSWNNAPWKAFTNDFQYLMSRVIFTQSAYCGAFVVSEDWFLTHYGTLVNSSGTKTVIDESNYNSLYPKPIPPFFLNGGQVNNGKVTAKVVFYASKPTKIKISASADSEPSYDWGAVGYPDETYIENGDWQMYSSGTNCLMHVSGDSTDEELVTISTAGRHFIEIGYIKDGSTSYGGDICEFDFEEVDGNAINGFTIEDVTKTQGMSVSSTTISSAPFAFFDPHDPACDKLPTLGYKFVPTKCVDGLTGEEWMAGGNVYVKKNGDVVLKNTMFADSIQSNKVDTQAVNGRRIHIEGGRLDVYNDVGTVGLSIGWDDNGDPYLTVAKVNSSGAVSGAYKLTYAGVETASASFTQDKFTGKFIIASGGSASQVNNNTGAVTDYHFTAARNTVTGAYSNENPNGGAASSTYQTYRANQDNRYFTTNAKTSVISSSGDTYRIADGYYLAAGETYSDSSVHPRTMYSASNGILTEVGTAYYFLDVSVGMWCDADGSNGSKTFDPTRYFSHSRE